MGGTEEMPVGWDRHDVELRMDNMQTQIQRMAQSVDAITAQLNPFDLDILKAQVKALSEQASKLATQPFQKS